MRTQGWRWSAAWGRGSPWSRTKDRHINRWGYARYSIISEMSKRLGVLRRVAALAWWEAGAPVCQRGLLDIRTGASVRGFSNFKVPCKNVAARSAGTLLRRRF